jgi:hypothetical protein
MKAFFAAVTALAAMSASVASAQRADRYVDKPVVRSFNWFDFVAANDIRAACEPGGRSHLRLVYNALWEEQVRVYEVYLQPDGTAGMNVGVLKDQGNVTPGITNMLLSDPTDVFGPWSMKRSQRLLNDAETRELLGLMEESRAFGPPKDGLRLPDNDFWWTVASCRNGVWGFQAYHYPTDAFANVKFSARLFSWDAVPIPVNPPRKLEPAELRRDMNAPVHRARADRWMLVVGKEGLRPR